MLVTIDIDVVNTAPVYPIIYVILTSMISSQIDLASHTLKRTSLIWDLVRFGVRQTIYTQR